MNIKAFQFNHFAQNTYVLYDETKEAVVVDPGCFFDEERKGLRDFLTREMLVVKKIIFTHCHLDHVFGAKFLTSIIPDVGLEAHRNEKYFIDTFQQFASSFGVKAEQPPALTAFINEGDTVSFGNTSLVAILVPGHSPGSLCYYCEDNNILITGDVLFRGSVGRSDLPGGNAEILISGIVSKLLVLPDDTVVYPGHGQTSSIGHERVSNPFLINA